MRPYLAIIKDSFREALASYLLWILLAICTLPLLVVAPLALEEQESVGLTNSDVVDPMGLLDKVTRAAGSEDPSPARQVWESMSKEYKDLLTEVLSVEDPEKVERSKALALMTGLPRELNRALANPYFYEAEAFKGVEHSEDTRDILDRGLENLSTRRISRLNRLLLHDAFPREIAAARETDYVLKFFHWKLFKFATVDKNEMLGGKLAWLIHFIMGFIALWLAIIFTSGFVPRAFEGGSVDLLLSKPVARPLIFLSKFVGGCSFILLCSSYFIGGLWLIIGWRFDFWDWRLLLSIPILLFLFAIYYSVSALAGVVWRSAVVSVVVAIAFWAVCFGVENAKKGAENFFLRRDALRHIIKADRSLLAVDEDGRVLQWFGDLGEWQVVFDNPEYGPPPYAMYAGLAKLVGPVYNPDEKEIVAMYSYGDRLMVGKAEERWQQELGLELPQMASSLFVGPAGNVYVVSFFGIFRMADQVEDYDPQGPAPPPAEPGGPGFVPASPQIRMLNRFTADMQPDTGDIIIYDQVYLRRFERREDGSFSLAASQEVKAGNAVVAYLKDKILLGLEDGSLQVYNPALEKIDEKEVGGGTAFRSIQAAPNAKKAAVLLHNQELWLYDAKTGELTKADVAGQGEICAANYADGALLVGDDFTRLSEYDAETLKLRDRFRGPMSPVEKVYRFGIKPLYTIFPKPTEMEDLVEYLLTRKKTVGSTADLSQSRSKLNVWQPFWSSLIFMVVILGLTCAYVRRKDF